MTQESLPILYSFRRCPYAMRARLALAGAGCTVQLREIVLRQKPAHLLHISPKGTVPVLLLSDQTVIEQSLDIMYWALQQADPDHLLPTGSERREMEQLIAVNDGAFKACLDRYKYPPRYAEEHGTLSPQKFGQLHRDQGAEYLKQLEQRLAQQPFLLGQQLTMADLAIAPFVRQFAHTDIDWFQQQDWPQVWRWLQDFLQSTRFAKIMHKYEPWKEGDAITLFPPETC